MIWELRLLDDVWSVDEFEWEACMATAQEACWYGDTVIVKYSQGYHNFKCTNVHKFAAL